MPLSRLATAAALSITFGLALACTAGETTAPTPTPTPVEPAPAAPVEAAAPVVGALIEKPPGGASCYCMLPGKADMVYYRAPAASEAVMNIDGKDVKLALTEEERPKGRIEHLTGDYTIDLQWRSRSEGGESAQFDGRASFIKDGATTDVKLDCECGA